VLLPKERISAEERVHLDARAPPGQDRCRHGQSPGASRPSRRPMWGGASARGRQTHQRGEIPGTRTRYTVIVTLVDT
jgi:hypothetical protein